ncbi:MAG TPA: alkaline phosphatase family protein [Nocardioidaceae bacterium]|nr:alkaline phosphatase family protein [Nocardioidaceae bacterium]
MRILSTLVLVAVLTAGCGDRPADPAPSVGASPTRVLLISVDALNPRAITELGAWGAPAFHRLIAEGASTLNARTLFEETETLPNHTSMFTGLRAQLPRGHGVRFNSDNGSTLRKVAGRYIPGIFDVVHDHGGRTAMYVAKDKFRLLDRSWDGRNGARDLVGADNGRDKVDRFVLRRQGDETLASRVAGELLNHPRRLTFLHLGGPDVAGHEFGGMSPEYLSAVRATDALIGQLLDTIASSPALSEHLLVVLTSDHGTNRLHHDAARRLANYRIPFFAWGPGVAAGADLYALNPDLLEPGRSRPTYDGVQPIRNGDAANLINDALGLPPVRGSEFRALDLGPGG